MKYIFLAYSAPVSIVHSIRNIFMIVRYFLCFHPFFCIQWKQPMCGMTYGTMLPFWPKYQISHPETIYFHLPKTTDGPKYPKNVWFTFENRSIANRHLDYTSTGSSSRSSVCKIKNNMFNASIYKRFVLVMKINNCQGDLPDISAKTKALSCRMKVVWTRMKCIVIHPVESQSMKVRSKLSSCASC